MAITPAFKTDTDFLEKEISYFEKEIDKVLESMMMELSHMNSYMIMPPNSLTQKHFEILKKRYFLSGWEGVSMETEERQDNYGNLVEVRFLKFSKKKEDVPDKKQSDPTQLLENS